MFNQALLFAQGFPSNGLVYYTRLDGNSRSVTPNGLNGTDTNIIYSAVNGKINQGAGGNAVDSRIILANSTVFDVPAVTINIWVKLALVPSNSWFFSKGPVNTQYGLFENLASQELIFRFKDLTHDLAVLNTTAGIVANQWFMVTATYNPTGTSPQQKMYVNGVLVGSRVDTTALTTAQTGEFIGAYADAAGSYNFNGAMDEIGVWNRALTQDEITSLYDGGAGLQY